jgi:ribosomal protein L37E
MDSRGWCTLAVRGLGLWMAATFFPTVAWGVVVGIRMAVSTPRTGFPGDEGWRLAESLGSVLVFLLGCWLLIDGKEVIDHFQFVTGRCPRCGYDLIKVRGDKCPECGLPRSRKNREDLAGSEQASNERDGSKPR